MARDYSGEPPLGRKDRKQQTERASKWRYVRRYALTIECGSEEDQQKLFRAAQTHFKGRRIRVVVA